MAKTTSVNTVIGQIVLMM